MSKQNEKIDQGLQVEAETARNKELQDINKIGAGSLSNMPPEAKEVYDKAIAEGATDQMARAKVKGTLHWVSIQHAQKAQVNLYDRLFSEEFPDADKEVDFKTFLNSDSLKTVTGYIEPSLNGDELGKRFQFQRLGYFCIDLDSTKENIIINKTVGLKDTWAKQQ